MIDWACLTIGKQILLADVGHIAVVAIFREQVIEWLFPVRPDFRRNRFVPFLAIGEDRIDIEDNAAKIEHPVAHDIADPEPRLGPFRRFYVSASLRRIKGRSFH